MADLSYLEKKLLEDLLGMGSGYVLDFSDYRYALFFRDHGINIDDPKYHAHGRSKAKRLRTFWEIEPNEVVGRVLEALFDYIEHTSPRGAGGPVRDKHRAIVHRLLGRRPSNTARNEDEFLRAEFGEIDVRKLSLDIAIEAAIEQRLEEIGSCLAQKAPLAAIILCGSVLEGILLDAAIRAPIAFNQAAAAPKKDGKTSPFHAWKLSNFIDVAHEVGLIGLDVKKFSHALRDFRNYVHPFEQVASKFKPDEHTARISWQVLRAAIADLTAARKARGHHG